MKREFPYILRLKTATDEYMTVAEFKTRDECVRMMRKAVNLYLGKVRINYRDMVAQNKNGDQIFLIVKEEG